MPDQNHGVPIASPVTRTKGKFRSSITLSMFAFFSVVALLCTAFFVVRLCRQIAAGESKGDLTVNSAMLALFGVVAVFLIAATVYSAVRSARSKSAGEGLGPLLSYEPTTESGAEAGGARSPAGDTNSGVPQGANRSLEPGNVDHTGEPGLLPGGAFSSGPLGGRSGVLGGQDFQASETPPRFRTTGVVPPTGVQTGEPELLLG
ncbi:hypothetical protein NRI_0147 [Neorickettsia risticii str. Illinois]|uniref:Uncharacterized protein n=1 Tax=Neorickettsia risticii (strain Illinois) TaxID=434131 RepID=C6V427_NEORI|nr:hypothetical protein [Neorickettsia risticii]ACT69144.1 hypothetical protein NRI_0147 [Neorickettsia risticii str. Illinois]